MINGRTDRTLNAGYYRLMIYAAIVGRTFNDSTYNSTKLSIPKDLARKLQIENSKVSMTLA